MVQEHTIRIELIAPPGLNPFDGATHVRLRVDDAKDGDIWAIEAFYVADLGTYVPADGQWHRLHVEALTPEKQIVARGSSPPIRFSTGQSAPIQIVLRPVGKFSFGLGSLVKARVDFAVAELADQLYILGGFGGGSYATDVEKVSRYLTHVRIGPPLPQGTRGPIAVVSFGQQILLLGGDGGQSWALDPDADSWRSVSSVGDYQHMASVQVDMDQWHLVGGWNKKGPSIQTQRIQWDGQVLEVEEASPLLLARDTPTALQIGQRILVVGGHSSSFGEWLGQELIGGPAARNHAAIAYTKEQAVILGGDLAQIMVVSADGSVVESGTLALIRRQPTLNRLPDGRLLVIGGSDAPTAAFTAEILEQQGTSWMSTGLLETTVTHTRHQSVWLADDNLLVVGGLDADGALSMIPEVYVAPRP